MNLEMININLAGPIVSAELVKDGITTTASDIANTAEAFQSEQTRLLQELEVQKDQFAQACNNIESICEKLNSFCDQMFADHSEEIANLSVEIARKVLARQVKEGNYDIHTIIEDVLQNAPDREDLTIHLNPDDMVIFQEAQKTAGCKGFEKVRFINDPSINRAECKLESSKGIINSMVDAHLSKIANALIGNEGGDDC